jgi:hypothetical protein
MLEAEYATMFGAEERQLKSSSFSGAIENGLSDCRSSRWRASLPTLPRKTSNSVEPGYGRSTDVAVAYHRHPCL